MAFNNKITLTNPLTLKVHSLLLGLICLCLAACDDSPESDQQSKPPARSLDREIMLADFNNGLLPSYISANNGDVSIVAFDQTARNDKSPDASTPDTQTTQQAERSKALKVNLFSKDNWSAALNLQPDTPWDWSQHRDFNLAFDVANYGSESVQIDLVITDINGDAYTRVFVIPVGDATTVYAKMDGHDQTHPDGTPINEFNFISGLRSNPPTWQSTDRQVYSLWGKKSLALEGITGVNFNVSGNLSDREFILDNLRLRPNPPMDPNFLVDIVDEFGQFTRANYSSKISSLEQLKTIADQEMSELAGTTWPNRSRFHGWKGGPKQTATGYFRTEKVNGKWWLVDPQGYLYFSTGLDIIRLSNSSTITGYDFDASTIQARDVNEIISEDDQPLNRVNEDAIPSRTLINQTRANMFSWLPKYDDPLGDHFGYRRSVQSGPMKHGETFSFYSANLERRYGETYPKSYMDTWRDVTIKRMIDWGFTSFGNWAEPEFYANTQIPFIAFADINGDFGTITSGFDFWHPLPDPFDPKFYDRALVSAQFVAEQINASPWCMGIFYDNEQSFGRPETDKLYFGLVLNTLKENAETTPAKAAFTKILQEKYRNIADLNSAWQTSFGSWDQFATMADAGFTTPEQRQDYSDLLYAFGKQYFGSIRRATKKVLPNHLYLGARMADWGRPDEIVRAAAEESDALSFNLYEDGYKASHWQILDELDKPTLIGEFGFGADDAGHFHPGIVVAADQKDRARKYKAYMHSIIDSPHFIGAHMFQYMDGPITGRAYDGENYNFGFVSITDIPYAPLVEAAKEVHGELYTRRFGAPSEKNQ